MQRVVLAVFLVVACTTVAAADSYEEAEFAYDRGNYTHAARLFRPLAEQGIPAAQFHMGLMYEKGQGVPQDYRTALKWFRMAAEQGYAGPQNNLGLMYERGRGVRQDVVRAHMWYDIAATMLSGNDGKAAMERRDRLASRMATAEIEKAKEMAQRCQKTKFKECE